MRTISRIKMLCYAAAPVGLLVMGASVVTAQVAGPPAQPNASIPSGCTPSARATSPNQSPTVGSGGDLSDKLASSNGVICPPSGIDPNIHQPAPGGGVMPVIPPPGSPGGDQSTVPK